MEKVYPVEQEQAFNMLEQMEGASVTDLGSSQVAVGSHPEHGSIALVVNAAGKSCFVKGT